MLFSEHLLLSTPAASELALTADDVHRFQWVERELTAFWEMQRGEVLGRHTTDWRHRKQERQPEQTHKQRHTQNQWWIAGLWQALLSFGQRNRKLFFYIVKAWPYRLPLDLRGLYALWAKSDLSRRDSERSAGIWWVEIFTKAVFPLNILVLRLRYTDMHTHIHNTMSKARQRWRVCRPG